MHWVTPFTTTSRQREFPSYGLLLAVKEELLLSLLIDKHCEKGFLHVIIKWISKPIVVSGFIKPVILWRHPPCIAYTPPLFLKFLPTLSLPHTFCCLVSLADLMCYFTQWYCRPTFVGSWYLSTGSTLLCVLYN